MSSLKSLLLSIGCILAVAGCETVMDSEPAVLASSDQQSVDTVMTTLAAAMGRASVELGPGDMTRSSMISVLPPRPTALEDRSMAMPVEFQIRMRGPNCVLVRMDSGEEFALRGASCKSEK